MIAPAAQHIEEYLLDAAGDGWVKGKELCARFGIAERQLRKVGDAPGLCSGFAISSDKGFKHVARASTTEFRDFKHRLRRHAIAELTRVRDLDRRRHQVTKTTKRPEFTREKDTGQGLLFAAAGPGAPL
jgi:hypothetical protein